MKTVRALTHVHGVCRHGQLVERIENPVGGRGPVRSVRIPEPPPMHCLRHCDSQEIKPEPDREIVRKWSDVTVAAEKRGVAGRRVERGPECNVVHRVASDRVFPVDQSEQPIAVGQHVVTALSPRGAAPRRTRSSTPRDRSNAARMAPAAAAVRSPALAQCSTCSARFSKTYSAHVSTIPRGEPAREVSGRASSSP